MQKQKIDNVDNKKTIDLTEILNEYVYYAEEFAQRMENMYDEPSEYSTSLHESLTMSLANLQKLYSQKDYVKNNTLNIKIVVPSNFMELINEHKCSCSQKAWDNFTSLFNQSTIITK